MLQNTAVGAGGMGMGIAAAGAGPMMPSTYREGLGGMGGPQGGPSTPAGGGYQSPSGPEGAMGNMGDQRGKLTGDICLTVELSEVCTSAGRIFLCSILFNVASSLIFTFLSSSHVD